MLLLLSTASSAGPLQAPSEVEQVWFEDACDTVCSPTVPCVQAARIPCFEEEDPSDPVVWTTCLDAGICDPVDTDADGWPDHEDNCPTVHNPDQASYHGSGPGDACRTVPSCESMVIGGGLCQGSYAPQDLDGCLNPLAPPRPSLFRGISSPEAYEDFGLVATQLPEDHASTVYQDARGPGEHVVIPPRSSNAGRVMLHLESCFEPTCTAPSPDHSPPIAGFVFRTLQAEALGYDQLHGGVRPFSGARSYQSTIPPQAMQDPRHSSLDYDGNQVTGWGIPSYHYAICEASGSGAVEGAAPSDLHNPRACRAWLGPSGEPAWSAAGSALLEGECHDLSALMAFELAGRWELVSNDFTVFVPQDARAYGDHVRVFPRAAPGVPLEAFAYHIAQHPAGELYSTPFHQQCGSADPHHWCNWTQTLRRRGAFHMDEDGDGPVPEAGEWWDDAQGALVQHGFGHGGLTLFEPTLTADGLLLVLNTMDGIWYSVNDHGPCDASGFGRFKPLSLLPYDTDTPATLGGDRVKDHWDLGAYPFRDSAGDPFPPGQRLPGAYPWIDRAGKNVFLGTVASARDGWHAVGGHDTTHLNPDTPVNGPGINGRGFVAMGAWTRGKQVVLDNLLNPTDWVGDLAPDGTRAEFDVALYQGAPLTLRPRGNQLVASFENQLNHLDALSPNLPFDVVWTFQSSTRHHAELAFDDYLSDDALVVAHMNARQEMVTFADGKRPLPSDGFTRADQSSRSYADPQGYAFGRNPYLQNAATGSLAGGAPFEPPRDLRLRGGARVEPVALGGVLGKGVYLDGLNDHADMGFLNPGQSDWFYGVWLDSRETDEDRVRTVWYWPDGSWVGLSSVEIVVYNGPLADVQTIALWDPADPLRDLLLPHGAYFHLGLRSFEDGGARVLAFTIDGDPVFDGVRSWPVDAGFSLDHDLLGGWSWFVLGDPGPAHVSAAWGDRAPFLGWVDELKILRLPPRHLEPNFVGDVAQPNFYHELICNQALGTLRHASPGHQGSTTHEVGCEQLNLASHDTVLELGPQASVATGGHLVDLDCADRVHRNDHSPALVECLRSSALSFHGHTADVARADFSGNAFCQGCHHPSARIDGLLPAALGPGVVPRACDARRQPLDWPAVLGTDRHGLSSNTCVDGTGGYALDAFVEGSALLGGYGKVEP